jgi:hypothetical protein
MQARKTRKRIEGNMTRRFHDYTNARKLDDGHAHARR